MRERDCDGLLERQNKVLEAYTLDSKISDFLIVLQDVDELGLGILASDDGSGLDELIFVETAAVNERLREDHGCICGLAISWGGSSGGSGELGRESLLLLWSRSGVDVCGWWSHCC